MKLAPQKPDRIHVQMDREMTRKLDALGDKFGLARSSTIRSLIAKAHEQEFALASRGRNAKEDITQRPLLAGHEGVVTYNAKPYFYHVTEGGEVEWGPWPDHLPRPDHPGRAWARVADVHAFTQASWPPPADAIDIETATRAYDGDYHEVARDRSLQELYEQRQRRAGREYFSLTAWERMDAARSQQAATVQAERDKRVADGTVAELKALFDDDAN